MRVQLAIHDASVDHMCARTSQREEASDHRVIDSLTALLFPHILVVLIVHLRCLVPAWVLSSFCAFESKSDQLPDEKCSFGHFGQQAQLQS